MKTCNGSAAQSYLCPFSASGSEFMKKKESIPRSGKEGMGARVKAIIFWSGRMSVAQGFQKMIYKTNPV